MHESLHNLPFKRGQTAIAFKFDYNVTWSATSPLRCVMGYSEVKIVSAGSVRVRYQYDGSLFERAYLNQIGETVEYDVQAPTWADACQNSWGLGQWLLVPKAVITDDTDMAYWVGIVKSEFRRHLTSKYGASSQSMLCEVDNCELQPMSVEQWNKERLAIMSDNEAQAFTSIAGATVE